MKLIVLLVGLAVLEELGNPLLYSYYGVMNTSSAGTIRYKKTRRRMESKLVQFNGTVCYSVPRSSMLALLTHTKKMGFAFSIRRRQSASGVTSWTFLGRGHGSNRGQAPDILTEYFITFA